MDPDDLLEGLRVLLSESGHAVTAARDGLAALDAARTVAPAVVMIEIGLPGIDGYEIARRLRAMPNGEQMFLVALSRRQEDREQAEAAWFDAYLVKPGDLDHLVEVIRRVRRGHRA